MLLIKLIKNPANVGHHRGRVSEASPLGTYFPSHNHVPHHSFHAEQVSSTLRSWL